MKKAEFIYKACNAERKVKDMKENNRTQETLDIFRSLTDDQQVDALFALIVLNGDRGREVANAFLDKYLSPVTE